LRDLLLGDHARGQQPLFQLRDPVFEHGLLVLGVVVLGVLGDVSEFAGCLDPLRDLAAPLGGEQLDLPLELLVALGSEDYVLHDHRPPGLDKEKAAALGRQRGREGYMRSGTNVKAPRLRSPECRSTCALPGGSATSRSRRASSWRRWRASAS